MALINQLQQYHDMGLTLIPVDHITKKPLMAYKQYKEIKQKFKGLEILYNTYPGADWAVYCINGIVGLDFDCAKTYEEFFKDIETLTTKSPSNGYHTFIKSLTRVKSFQDIGIEIKVNELNTLVGDAYEVIKDAPIKEFEDAESFIKSRLPKLKPYKGKDIKKFKNLKISDVIELYCEKKKEGHGYWQALCPIHGDKKTPHLYVYEDSDKWYCFKCKKGGSAAHFVSEMEGIKLKDVPALLKDKLDISFETEEEEIKIPVGTLRHNGVLYEQIMDDNWKYVSYQNDGFVFNDEIIDLDNGITYIPCVDDEVTKGAVHFPSGIQDYSSLQSLIKDIEKFILKWLDIPDKDRKFYSYYILQSWVFECFHTIGYPRAMGDTGTGKTRFLDVIGGLCYKAIFTNGAIGAAPIFRIMDKHRGTLVIDEANFGRSDETQAIITILNSGWEKGKPVLRCDKENPNIINTFDPFGPKVLATRSTFYDKALEARCYTVSITQTDRDDIPANIDEAFYQEKNEIVNRLLAFRLKNIDIIKYNPELQEDFKGIEPRIIQKALPLASIVKQDETAFMEFVEYIRSSQDTLIDERQESYEGMVVLELFSLLEEELKRDDKQDLAEIILSAKDITDQLNEKMPKKDKKTNQWTGKRLKNLGIDRVQKRVKALDTNSKIKWTNVRSLATNPTLILKLLKRYTFLPAEEYPKLWLRVSCVASTLEDTLILNNNKINDLNLIIGGSLLEHDTIDTLDTNLSEINNYYISLWQKNNGIVNSTNLVKFCMDCAAHTRLSTTEIKPIAEKFFAITPKPEQVFEEQDYTLVRTSEEVDQAITALMEAGY